LSDLENNEKIRIDKWLWMTRFFKTRKQATEAVNGGKIHVNNQRVKAAYKVRISDSLDITRSQEHWSVDVLAIPKRRGPAKEAQLMYLETEESISRRSVTTAIKRAERYSRPREEVKPDKHQRKELRRLKNKE